MSLLLAPRIIDTGRYLLFCVPPSHPPLNPQMTYTSPKTSISSSSLLRDPCDFSPAPEDPTFLSQASPVQLENLSLQSLRVAAFLFLSPSPPSPSYQIRKSFSSAHSLQVLRWCRALGHYFCTKTKGNHRETRFPLFSGLTHAIHPERTDSFLFVSRP